MQKRSDKKYKLYKESKLKTWRKGQRKAGLKRKLEEYKQKRKSNSSTSTAHIRTEFYEITHIKIE